MLHGIINFFGLSHAFYGNNLYTLNQTWWYMSLALVLVLLVLHHAKPWFQSVLSFIGLHSANIFYLHSFVYHYWPTSYLVNFFRVGFLEFAATVFLTVLLSQILEHWKKVLGWDACFGRIFSRLS